LKNGDHKRHIKISRFTTAQTTKLLTRRSSKKVNVAGINLELDEYKREIDNIETKYKTRQAL
jgi:hypothetical protein